MVIGILIGVSTTAGGGTPAGPTNGILQESGDDLLAESGDFLAQE